MNHQALWLGTALLLAACRQASPVASKSASATQKTLYVDGAVSKSGDGSSQQQAFKTIGECVQAAAPGTACLIAGGVYRETVGVNKSGQAGAPIVLKPLGNKAVVLSGAELITPGKNGLGSWSSMTLNGRTVYRIKLSSEWDLGAGKNQLFVDGEAPLEAHWPNVSDPFSLVRQDLALSATGALVKSLGGGQHIGEYQHPGIKGHWGGGRMIFASGKDWSADEAKITSAQKGKIQFQFTPNHGLENSTPTASDPFMLIGKREAIDEDGEWYLDAAGAHGDPHTLYVALAAAPAGKKIEMRRRGQVLNINAAKHVTVEGLQLHGGAIYVGDAAAHVTVDRLTVEYGRSELDSLWTSVIQLKGSNNRLLRSTVRHHSGVGISVTGTDNRVEDSVIHGSITKPALAALADCLRCVVTQNTVFHAPGHGVVVSGLRDGEASYNRVYWAARWVADVAGMNAWSAGDGKGSVIHHNRVHHVHGYLDQATKHYGGFGIRLDSGGGNGNSNFVVHHNIVYETTSAAYSIWGLVSGQPNFGNTKNHVYNNTGSGEFDLAVWDSSRSAAGTVAKNNLVLGGTDFKQIPKGAVIKTNLFSKISHPGNQTGSPGFTDASTYDFSLLSTSAAVDAGEKIAPYTTGFVGSAPDLGALERGAARFVAGALVGPEHLAGLKVTCSGTTTCEVTGLPTGRHAPQGFVLRVDGKKSSGCRNRLVMKSNEVVVTCTFAGAVPAAPGEVAASLDGTKFVVIHKAPAGDGQGPLGDGPPGDGSGSSGDGAAVDHGGAAGDNGGAAGDNGGADAGSGPRGEDGCSCRVTAPAGAPPLLLLLFLGLLILGGRPR